MIEGPSCAMIQVHKDLYIALHELINLLIVSNIVQTGKLPFNFDAYNFLLLHCLLYMCQIKKLAGTKSNIFKCIARDLIGRRQWHPTPVLLPGKSHEWRSLVRCSPWGHQVSDTTERLHFHFSVSCTGEGNGNPLQCSCLENPRDGRAWWAAVYGVAQSRTRLKRCSSSSSLEW